jgi:hypothetical protein
MHLSTFAARWTEDGWVIDATKIDGRVEQLIGLYNTEAGAMNWITAHPVAWWKLQSLNKASTETASFIRRFLRVP